MSLYIVVEGERTEPALLRGWLPRLAPGLTPALRVEDVGAAHYFMVAGRGYPSYLARIQAAVEDIRAFPAFSWLLVLVDAEERTAEERRSEVEEVVRDARCPIPSAVFVADCCVETWLLGNPRVLRRNPSSAELRAHLAHYHVGERDPERMPLRPDFRNRAHHHIGYLKAVFAEQNISFSKSRPGHAADPAYLDALIARAAVHDGGGRHLRSFGELSDFFASLTSPDGMG